MKSPNPYAASYFPEPEPLWPAGAPGWVDPAGQEEWEARDIDLNARGLNRALWHVQVPAVQVYLPTAEANTGVAVVIYPGGAHTHLAIDKEGYDVATWLNALGIAGIVVRYRVGDAADREQSVEAAEADAKRAMRWTRHNAARLGINPDKIGVMGFSAGGRLVATVGTEWDEGDPTAADPVERASCQPAFLVPIYPGIREKHLANVSAKTPPAFMAHAYDDKRMLVNVVAFFEALRKAGVTAELHIFAGGGHGFGLGAKGGGVAWWPELFAEWLEATL